MISKTQSIVVICVSIFTSIGSSLAAYNKVMNDLARNTERTQIQKEDILVIQQKLDRLSQDVAEIKGYLKK